MLRRGARARKGEASTEGAAGVVAEPKCLVVPLSTNTLINPIDVLIKSLINRHTDNLRNSITVKRTNPILQLIESSSRRLN